MGAIARGRGPACRVRADGQRLELKSSWGVTKRVLQAEGSAWTKPRGEDGRAARGTLGVSAGENTRVQGSP